MITRIFLSNGQRIDTLGITAENVSAFMAAAASNAGVVHFPDGTATRFREVLVVPARDGILHYILVSSIVSVMDDPEAGDITARTP